MLEGGRAGDEEGGHGGEGLEQVELEDGGGCDGERSVLRGVGGWSGGGGQVCHGRERGP